MTPLSPRRLKLLALARDAGDRLFNPSTGLCLISRDTLWYAISLLCEDAAPRRALGLRLAEDSVSEDGTHTPATMIAMLHALEDILSPGARDHLRAEIARELVHAAETQWRDGNVNHPLGAYCTLVLGGEASGAPWAADLGTRRLAEFQRLTGDRRFVRSRQAEMSEYNSPTYTALDIVFLAMIAHYARGSEARRLAVFLEERLWLDVALHFHAPSGQFAGPHSRCYQDDSTGGYSALHAALSAACEGDVFLAPELCVRFNHPSSLLQCALTAIVPMHMPAEAARLAWEKPFPFLMQKTTYCEQYHENRSRIVAGGKRVFAFDDEVYPGGLRDLTTYMTGEYAIGSASLPYVNGGHTDAFSVRIARRSPVSSMADFRSAYTRGVYNGAALGGRNLCHVTGSEIDESYLYEEGRTAIYQHRNRAIVLYGPKRAGHAGVRSFRLDLIFGHFAPFTSLMLGNSPVERFPARGGSGAGLFFHDGRVYGAVIPLGPDPPAGPAPVLLDVRHDHMILSLFTYDGPARDFSREEMLMWRTGFAVELATADEFPTFDAFLARAGELRATETQDPGGVRRAAFSSPDGTMTCVYDPAAERFISRAWNGREESTEHMIVEGGTPARALLTPLTLFGSEAMRAGQ
ncbi:MAG TPA: hypothetical protein VMM80_03900 [Bacteroidota bacterium]|nr:hypothetical protein [Bacteroidota bacterium]